MLAPWAHPGRRIDRYQVVIAYRFHFDPRVMDEWTVPEFDRFAMQCDAMDAEDAKQQRAAERRAGGTRRR